MVKTVLGVKHQGLRDWLIQRVTALVLSIYSFGLLAFLMRHSDLAYYEWHELFVHPWMKAATLLTVGCLLYHAWIGIWTVFTDYVKSFALNFVLQVVVFLALIICFLQTLLILWGV